MFWTAVQGRAGYWVGWQKISRFEKRIIWRKRRKVRGVIVKRLDIEVC